MQFVQEDHRRTVAAQLQNVRTITSPSETGDEALISPRQLRLDLGSYLFKVFVGSLIRSCVTAGFLQERMNPFVSDLVPSLTATETLNGHVPMGIRG